MYIVTCYVYVLCVETIRGGDSPRLSQITDLRSSEQRLLNFRNVIIIIY